MTTPVSFEIAKLLKEKGFEQTLEVGVICRIQNKINKDYQKTRPLRESDLTNEWSILNEIYPTIVEVVMWLYEKHGIWIIVDWSQTKWCFSVIDVKEDTIKKVAGDKWKERSSGVYLKTELDFNSPTEAYEAAIEYTLKNLI